MEQVQGKVDRCVLRIRRRVLFLLASFGTLKRINLWGPGRTLSRSRRIHVTRFITLSSTLSFTKPDSPIVLFEATYTKEFSGNAEATPRHDYNQVLYRLDLDELPVR